MGDDGTEAGRRGGEAARQRGNDAARRPGGGAARREGAKPPGGGKRPASKTVRRQFHIDEQTAQRLGVHCSLVNRNESAIVEEILSAWLTRYGRGKELWNSGGREDDSPDTQEDRQDGPSA